MNLLKRAFLLGAAAAVASLPARAKPVVKAQARPTPKAAPKAPARAPVRGRAPAPAPARAPAPPPLRSPVLLTVSGAIKRHNRGALDPVVDQMAHKHGLAFEQAFGFDAAALANLPTETIQPTLEYDGKPHTLVGPTLEMVLASVGIAPGQPGVQLTLYAVDGYRVEISLAEVREQRMILATRIDGQTMALGGFGPVWAVVDADRVAALKDKPLAERFQRCPWGLYHVDVRLA